MVERCVAIAAVGDISLIDVVATSLYLLLREEVIAFGPLLAVVVGSTQRVATLELCAVSLAPRIDIVHSTESLLRLGVAIHIVRLDAYRSLRLLAEEVDVAIHIAIVLPMLGTAWLGSIDSSHLTEDSGLHLVVRNEVYSLVAITVIYARELRLVTQLIKHLDRLNSLGRYGLDGCRHILAKELTTVDEHLLHLLAVCLYLAIVDLDAGHLLQKLVGIGIGQHLVG